MKKPYREIEFELLEFCFTDIVMSNTVSQLDDNELPPDLAEELEP